MTHPDEGRLQAYLDHEMPTRERAVLAEHLLACSECRAELEGLNAANELFHEAVAALDVPAPSVEPPAELTRTGAGVRSGGGAFVRAAGLVLLLAAAASAAVPGSPVREWVVALFDGDAEQPVATSAPAPPAGLALVPEDGTVEVVVIGLSDAIIRLSETETGTVSVRASGGAQDPVFRTSSSRIEVSGGRGGELLVEWPRALRAGRLVVDGRTYAVRQDGALRVLAEPSSESAFQVVWE